MVAAPSCLLIRGSQTACNEAGICRVASPGGAAFSERPPDALSGEDLEAPPQASRRLWDGRPIDSDNAGSRNEHDHSGAGACLEVVPAEMRVAEYICKRCLLQARCM